MESNEMLRDSSGSPDPSLVLSIEVPSLEKHLILDFALKPGSQEEVLQDVVELAQTIEGNLHDQLLILDTEGTQSKLKRFRSQSLLALENWNQTKKACDDGFAKIAGAKETMNAMRESYFRELMQLREQVHRKSATEALGQIFAPTEMNIFDPSDYTFDDEIGVILKQKVEFLEAKWQTAHTQIVQNYNEHTSELNLKIGSLRLLADRKDELLKRKQRLLSGLLTKHGYEDERAVHHLLELCPQDLLEDDAVPAQANSSASNASNKSTSMWSGVARAFTTFKRSPSREVGKSPRSRWDSILPGRFRTRDNLQVLPFSDAVAGDSSPVATTPQSQVRATCTNDLAIQTELTASMLANHPAFKVETAWNSLLHGESVPDERKHSDVKAEMVDCECQTRTTKTRNVKMQCKPEVRQANVQIGESAFVQGSVDLAALVEIGTQCKAETIERDCQTEQPLFMQPKENDGVEAICQRFGIPVQQQDSLPMTAKQSEPCRSAVSAPLTMKATHSMQTQSMIPGQTHGNRRHSLSAALTLGCDDSEQTQTQRRRSASHQHPPGVSR